MGSANGRLSMICQVSSLASVSPTMSRIMTMSSGIMRTMEIFKLNEISQS